MRRMRTAIYPGSFDPLTNGHLDLVQRATKLFDQVVVAVARSESKNPLFTLAERVALVEQAVKKIPNVTTDSFDGLLVDYVEKRGGQAVIRGLRVSSAKNGKCLCGVLMRRTRGVSGVWDSSRS